VITAGNQAVLKIADYVDVLGDDDHVSAIALYVEGLDDVPAFSRAALKARRNGKQIVAIKAGHSELGARLAMSHTSSLAGNDRLYDALFARLGIMRVDAIDILLETAKLASVVGVPKDALVAACRSAGGKTAMAASDLSELIPAPARRRMIELGCAPLQGLEAAVTAFAALARRGRQSAGAEFALPKLARAPADARLREEWECRHRLARHGLAFPAARFVMAAEAAA